MHRDITKNTLTRPECEGHFRDWLVGVVTDNRSRYIPPNQNKVPLLMEDFIEWLNTGNNDISPV